MRNTYRHLYKHTHIGKYYVHEVSMLVFRDFFMTMYTNTHTYKPLCSHSCVYRL